MNAKRMTLLTAILAALALSPVVFSTAAVVQPAAIHVKAGYYKTLVDFDFMRQNVDIPPKKGVMIIDPRPAARQYDPGHILGAVNIPDSNSTKMSTSSPPTRPRCCSSIVVVSNACSATIPHSRPKTGLHQYQGLCGRLTGLEGEGRSDIGVRRACQEADRMKKPLTY
ncbi:MAG: hypothetical protein IPP88_18880 [Betaproteobacteria bacterium]|nr:hypothetical protein [Betaproteobacteria bacterium]